MFWQPSWDIFIFYMILLVIFVGIVELGLIWNANVEYILSSSFSSSLIQKAACILVVASEYELNIIKQTFPQSMFQVGLFCSRSIFD